MANTLKIRQIATRFLLLLPLIFISSNALATAYISIIIDDLGNNYHYDMQAVNLPGQVTLAFLPFCPATKTVAIKAHKKGKEIMLHAPMQAIRPLPLGKGGLTINMTQLELDRTLLNDFKNIPYAQGFNNHMGSLLTQHPGDMNWLMQAIKPLGVFYVDSRTTADSVAEQFARKNGIPTTSRDIFLDDQRNTSYVKKQFQKLIAIARHTGTGVAIGHPYEVTLKFLQDALPMLKNSDIKLIPISTIIAMRDYQRGAHSLLLLHKATVVPEK